MQKGNLNCGPNWEFRKYWGQFKILIEYLIGPLGPCQVAQLEPLFFLSSFSLYLDCSSTLCSFLCSTSGDDSGDPQPPSLSSSQLFSHPDAFSLSSPYLSSLSLLVTPSLSSGHSRSTIDTVPMATRVVPSTSEGPEVADPSSLAF